MKIPRIKLLLCVTLAAAGLAWSQSSYTAAVRGVISDASGAAVAGAKVTVTESDRNVPHVVMADDAGRYALTALPPGNYSLSVEAKGFKRTARPTFRSRSSSRRLSTSRLQVGELATTVEVQSQSPLLNTTISTLGQVIENRYMMSLPNIGRNPLSLLNLTPGVVGAGGANNPTNTNFVANGARNSTSDVLVDGAIVNVTEQNTGATDLKWTPSVDAVQEFKMQTNFFGAEYAQSGGAVINMVTKSGTNEFHGDAYYFLRDSTLNANSWSANRAGRAMTYYRRDQLGAVFGGPIRKNKTFFFVTSEYTHAKSPSTQTATFPTLDPAKRGFLQTLFSDGRLITIYNPVRHLSGTPRRHQAQSLPGQHDPQEGDGSGGVEGDASSIPLPNQDPNPFTHVNNFFTQGIGESTTKPGRHQDRPQLHRQDPLHRPLQRQLEHAAPA